jgi:hypothetical protein
VLGHHGEGKSLEGENFRKKAHVFGLFYTPL